MSFRRQAIKIQTEDATRIVDEEEPTKITFEVASPLHHDEVIVEARDVANNSSSNRYAVVRGRVRSDQSAAEVRRRSYSISPSHCTPRRSNTVKALRISKPPREPLSPSSLRRFWQKQESSPKHTVSSSLAANSPPLHTPVLESQQSTLSEMPSVATEASGDLVYRALQTGNSSMFSQSKAPTDASILGSFLPADTDCFDDFEDPLEGRSFQNQLDSDVHSIEPWKIDSTPLIALKDPSGVSLRDQTDDKNQAEASEASYDCVERHTILELVTEDLMSDSWILVHQALERLYELCCTKMPSPKSENSTTTSAPSDCRIRFIQSGGHAFLVGVMKKFRGNARIQIAACRLMEGFVKADSANSAFSELLVTVRGVECLLETLKQTQKMDDLSRKSGDRTVVCGYTGRALSALVCSSANLMQRLVDDERTFGTFLESISSASSDYGSFGVCKVLCSIVKKKQYCRKVVKLGGVQFISEEMARHPNNEKISVHGCCALQYILEALMSTHQFSREIVHVALPNVVVAMKTFPENATLHLAATNLLLLCSHCDANAVKTAGGLSALGVAIENFPQIDSIQERGGATIKRVLLASSPKSSSSLGGQP